MWGKTGQGSYVKTTVPESIPCAGQYSVAILTFYSGIDSIVGAYHPFTPTGMDNKAW